MASQMTRVLSIAGSDPSGGAGVQADLKTFTALGVYGMAALTSLTSQNTVGVRQIESLPAAFVQDQVDAIIEDIGLDALKTGMLDSAAVVEKVVESIKHLQSRSSKHVWVVVDPVMVSTSGHTLLQAEAIVKVREALLPLASLVTPNVPEAELLLFPPTQQDTQSKASSATCPTFLKKIDSIAKMKEAARALTALGPDAALLKGGHHPFTAEEVRAEAAKGDTDSKLMRSGSVEPLFIRNQLQSARSDNKFIVDVLYVKKTESFTIYARPQVETKSTHGTGCTLSAALAANLSKGLSVEQSALQSIRYTQEGIVSGLALGKGHGPLNHMHNLVPRTVPKNSSVLWNQPDTRTSFSFVSLLIERASVDGLWQSYVHHPFVKELGKGQLRQSSFAYFLQQDYIFLMHYARIHSLGAFKARMFEEINSFQQIVRYILDERQMHIKYCSGFGIDAKTLAKTEEDMANVAYTRWVMDIAMSKSTLDLRVATAACLFGYGEAGLWLVQQASLQADGIVERENPYWTWVQSYASDNFQEAIRIGIQALEQAVEDEPPSPSRLSDLVETFRFAVKLEIGFWDSAMEH